MICSGAGGHIFLGQFHRCAGAKRPAPRETTRRRPKALDPAELRFGHDHAGCGPAEGHLLRSRMARRSTRRRSAGRAKASCEGAARVDLHPGTQRRGLRRRLDRVGAPPESRQRPGARIRHRLDRCEPGGALPRTTAGSTTASLWSCPWPRTGTGSAGMPTATGSCSCVRTTLVGDGKEEARYRRVVQDRGLRGVVFAGYVQQDELPRLYATADVLVFSTLGDPNGLVVEEAMASHLPVISCSPAGDIQSRVPDGVAGHVVPIQCAVLLGNRMANPAKDHMLRSNSSWSAAARSAIRTGIPSSIAYRCPQPSQLA